MFWEHPRKIQLIKTIRAESGCGLKEAKDALEEVGRRLPVGTSDEELVSHSLFHLDPRRFSPPPHTLDYRAMWEALRRENPDPDSGINLLMDHIERRAKKKAERIYLENHIAACLRKNLSTDFADIQGNNVCSTIYPSTGRSITVGIPKEELREILVQQFIKWVESF